MPKKPAPLPSPGPRLETLLREQSSWLYSGELEFAQSLSRYLERRGKLTEKQLRALGKVEGKVKKRKSPRRPEGGVLGELQLDELKGLLS